MPKTDGENQTQETGKESVVNRILSTLPQEETSEKTEKETSEEETEEAVQEEETELEEETEESEDESEEEEAEAEEILITAKIAQDLGLPKTFVGKPLAEAGKSYKETVKWENKNNQEIKQLKETVETLVSQLSDKDISKIEKEANEEAADEIPDPVTEPEAFSEWLTKRDDLIMQKVLEKVNNNPAIRTAEELAQRQMEQVTIQQLQAGLPEDVKAADVLENWLKDNEEDYEDMVKAGVYKNKPAKLIKDILNWHKASSYDSLKNQKDSDIKKQIHKKTVENLKAKGNKTKTNYSSNPRSKTTDSSAVGRILANLEQSAAIKDSP